MNQIIRRPAAQSWPLKNGFGNHRLIVRVSKAADYVMAEAQWRRRDAEPWKIGVRIKHLVTDAEITDIKILGNTRENCRIVFRAPMTGEYGIYFMPFVIEGRHWYTPFVRYMPAEDLKADKSWASSLPDCPERAEALAIESRTAFDLFGSMEVIASEQETNELIELHREKDFLIFTEDRQNPVMMFYDLPQKWITREGAKSHFNGSAFSDEYYVFQAAVYALKDIECLKAEFESDTFDTGRLTCFNTHGTDWLGRRFSKTLSVRKGEILPLWVGVDIPKYTDEAGFTDKICFDVSIGTGRASKEKISVELDISRENLPRRGDADLWRLSRLRWLNSGIGLEESTVKPYTPVVVRGDTVTCLGRSVTFGANALPLSIKTYYNNNATDITERARDVISEPIGFSVAAGGKVLPFIQEKYSVKSINDTKAEAAAELNCGNISMKTKTVMEYDGHAETYITLVSSEDILIDDGGLHIAMPGDAAKYMAGMGYEGGLTAQEWDYRWDEQYANNFLWVGNVYAGLSLKLKHNEDVWELYNFKKQGVPASWANGGNGGVRLEKTGGNPTIHAFTGGFTLKAGMPVLFRFSLLITPLKPIDTDMHWQHRYYHKDTWNNEIPDIEEAKEVGAAIINLHQGGPLNPFINYPFEQSDNLSLQTKQAHDTGLRYKIYYTVRELTNHAAELPVLRALGSEILMDSPNFRIADHFTDSPDERMTGAPWLCEHLTEGFVPAWQALLPNGEYDSAIAATGLSRWHNYYLEGLSWLIKVNDFDGIYLDGVGYDRQIMKRVRRTLDQAKPGCLIDFHSGNNYNPLYGLANPIIQYLELMPGIDSLWLGEGYDYENTSPEYWLAEVSGIPFGLMGDMLSAGGNRWRGMVFGMTARYGWQQGGNPVPVWELWKRFGMQGTKMLGWWDEDCPVKTNSDRLKATAFVGEDRCMIAVASWEKESAAVRFDIDWAKLNVSESDRITIPFIQDYQDEEPFDFSKPLGIEPNKGKIIIIRKG